MTEQNKHKKIDEAHLKIPTDIPLWDYLVQDIKKSHKASRVQAFFDLIERQHIALLKEDGGQLSATIQELANKWGWNRETVTRFLENLERLGLLSVVATGNRKTITLNYSIDGKKDTGAFPRPSEPLKPSGASNSLIQSFHGAETP